MKARIKWVEGVAFLAETQSGHAVPQRCDDLRGALRLRPVALLLSLGLITYLPGISLPLRDLAPHFAQVLAL